jgi:general secretion pathway protein G
MKTNSAILVFIAVLVVGAVRFRIPSRWFEEGAKLAPVKSDYHSISSALRTYKINAGHYPTTEQGLQALVERPTIPPLPDDWVQIWQRVPLDLWRNEYRYRCFPEGSPRSFELISKGPDGIEGTKDDRSLSDQPHPNSRP